MSVKHASETITKQFVNWLRLQYVQFVRLKLGHGMMPKLEDLSVVYHSDHFVVVNKRHDIVVNSDKADVISVATQLQHEYPELIDKNVQFGFRFAHRLDFATSGVLCVGLTKKSTRWAAKAFAHRNVYKHYLALVRGHMDPDTFRHRLVDISIGRDAEIKDYCRIRTVDHPQCSAPKQAHTDIVLLEHGLYEGRPASKILLIPRTGRTHQLRVHCAYVGHTIVGDYTYSDRCDVTPHRMMLHAFRLVLPMTREYIDVTADDPLLVGLEPEWQSTQEFQTYKQFFQSHNLCGEDNSPD